MKKKMRPKIQKHKSAKKPALLGSFLLCTACLLHTGCSFSPEQEEQADNMVVIDHEQEEFSYTTTTVSVEDVIRTARVSCTYRQAEESEITVSMIGRTVDEIYVKEGDTVTKGQLLAMLSGGDREAEIRELEYKIARNELLLGYTELDEEYDRSYKWWNYIYRTSMSEQDNEQLQKDLDAIHERYRYLREDYQDTIDLDTQQLEYLRQEMEQCRVYADKTGEISYLDPYILGSVIKEERLLLKISDRSQCVFESTQTQYSDCFQKGQSMELSLSSSGNTVYYEVTPTDMEHWQEKMLFRVTSGDASAIAMGTLGYIPITVDARMQVLAVPNSCVHRANDDQYFVYILNSSNVREIKWVQPGLRGDDMTEIIAGLTEGEQILLQ